MLIASAVTGAALWLWRRAVEREVRETNRLLRAILDAIERACDGR